MLKKYYKNEYSIIFDNYNNRYELWKKEPRKVYFKFEKYINNEEEVKEFIKSLTSKDKYTITRSSNL